MNDELYEGSVILTMAKNHVYSVSVDGAKKEKVPNVTTICGQMDKSRALMWWQKNCIRDAFEERFPVGKSFKFDEIQRSRALDVITTAAETSSKQAREVGTITHKYIELRLRGAQDAALPEHDEAHRAGVAFNEWTNDYEIKPLYLERKCFSKRFFYCGTFDFLGYINGVLTLVDFKTSKKIYPETFCQTSAYAEALEEEYGFEIKQRASLRCDKSDSSYEFLIFPDEHVRDFETFLGLLRLYYFNKRALKELKNLEE